MINLLTKRIKLKLLSKLSFLNSNFAVTLGYLNPVLNNSALDDNNRKFMQRRRRTSKKKVGLDWQKKTSLHVYHAFLYISWPLLHDRDMKLPNFTRPLYGVGEHSTKILFFFFITYIRSFRI